MKIQVSIEKVLEMAKRRKIINNLTLDKIEWTLNGKSIKIAQQVQDDFECLGLTNIDFITSRFYKLDTLSLNKEK